jgi:hypothetical protein
MRTRTPRLALVGPGVLAAALWSAPALAQDPPPAQGSVDVTPALAVDAFYRSNLYLQEGEAGGGTPTVSGGGMQFRPTLDLRTRSRQVWLDLGLGYTARVMFPKAYEVETDAGVRFDADGNVVPNLSNLNRFNFVDGRAALVLLPESVIGLKVSDQASITGRETEAVSATDAYLMLFRNQARGTLTVRPGSSLELDIGAESDIQQYSLPECDKDVGCTNIENNASLNGRTAFAGVADLTWKFFPKTAIVGSFEYGKFNWSNNFVNTQGDGLNPDELGNYLGVPDGTWWHADAGLRGRFTEKLVLGAVVGYTNMTYDEQTVIDDGANQPDALPIDLNAAGSGYDADLKGLTASVEVGFDLTENQRFVLSYGRDYQDVFFTNFVGFNRVTARYTGTAWKKFGYDISAMYRREAYSGEVSRDDHFIRAGADVGYAVVDWMDVTGGVAWTRRASVGGTNPAIEFDDTYLRAGLLFHY